ncbi:urease accessory protein UreD [Mycolicibacterium elephantis]|uniref:Urease accessory protein n=1 Tax=Mycolicibacterium elephantis TaxID=81858 RepID=A0A0M2ZA10_9MYCO|nr:urease accessory protein UreD [Mycolicibacterium elephantis]KKW62471.1 urease accessory protein UreD [Mycolicibacterium elephantis]OBA81025.1 urease accessory protein UreD [Mycolicibacterium elephantis]OBB19243.1 urease accessory protein UreD [Mycolicibacterium elephantis]OBE92850.1 urease accessory protein UreD [Mycolicibacterium elephantis]ORA65499.1 urease accessory protein [Mycolicibacterium elephantis]
MRSDVLIVASPCRRPRIECTGGLAARHTEADTVHLVSAAATPLGGDALHIRVVVEPGARLRVRTAAATVTLPGASTVESHALWHLEVAGDLDVDPEPTVVAATSRHHSATRLALTASGRIRLRERVQIGRSGERQGFWSGSLHADVDGSPLVRHRVELGSGSLGDDELGAPMACVSELHYPQRTARTAGMPLALAGGGCLSTWQGERL